MPVHDSKSVEREVYDGVDNPCGPGEALRYSDTGGLTQFGAFEEILPPGSTSSVKHWHATEDEMIYVLEGEVTLEEGDNFVAMSPGQVATFKAGEPKGHRLLNRTDGPVRYLVIGTRAPRDVITYPDDDRILTVDREKSEHVWTTHDGKPASNPYDLS